MPFKPSTLIDTIDAIGKVAADAARAADALDHHMRREQRALCCVRRWKASAIPFDCTTERWSDCYPRPPGARRADRAAVPSKAISGQAAHQRLGAADCD